MKLYFIAGASGSGKTAVMPYLKKILGDDIAVYDFDDIGVPDDADKAWRQKSTEQWLQKLLSDGEDACLLGQIVLGEILACPSAKQIDKINFCLMDVSDFERIQRLKKRDTCGVNQDMLNWSAWLRMHHQDPKWSVHTIQESSADIMDFSRFNTLANYDDVANINIFDTTHLLLNEVAKKLAGWINNNQPYYNNAELGLNPEYQIFEATSDQARILVNKINEFNAQQLSFTGDIRNHRNYLIKDHDGNIIAGIKGCFYHKEFLHIDALFVESSKRKQGLGSMLLNILEQEAISMKIKFIHLDTFDFQAKDFYLKFGYEIFGVLNNCLKNNNRYYMKKIS